MKFCLIIPVVFYFYNFHPLPGVEYTADGNIEPVIYLIKQQWHTGIVFKVEYIDTTLLSELREFKTFNYVDVGWGDEEFYQYPGNFDFGLAVKALFYPTPSTLRVEGFNSDIKRYIEASDFAIKIPVTQEQLNVLYNYISGTFYKNKNDSIEILSQKYSGYVKFYRANNKYHLFNTCNTWIAAGLEKAGFDINPSAVILAEDLFIQADNFGVVLKNKK